MPFTTSASSLPTSDCLVMFGVTGDLAKKKLFPAVYRLHCRWLLEMPIIGLARDDWGEDKLHQHARESIEEAGEKFDEKQFAALMKKFTYVRGDYSDEASYEGLKAAVGDAKHPIFHLAIPPSMFASVASGLASVGLNQGSRLIVEKPFGRDLASALELNETLHKYFDEEAIFRIDHFLGKEAMRSLLITRFANAILEPLWRRTHVESVKITMAESFGVEDRGAFYDSVGALRDVMQNHLLQMVALFAMEQPVNEHSKSLRDEKAKVLQAARPVDPKHFVRGQYKGYCDVEGVAADSDTETYGAFRLDFDSPRWGGVPFFIRAGKSMAATVTEMTIEFAAPPRPLWISDESHLPPNRIRIEAKPDSFTALTWLRKSPGDQMLAEPITLAPPPELRGDIGPEPYELLIEEAMAGDPTLFAREDSIEESWRIVEPILTDFPPCVEYDRGTWGPPPPGISSAGTAGGPKNPPLDPEVTSPPQAWPMRHGATEWSETGRHTGRTDLPLTAEGEAQARRLGEVLAGRTFALVLVSPLARAQRTCELAGYGGQAVAAADLVEFDYGDYEGLTTDQIRAAAPGWTIWSGPCPGGESLEQVATRADRVVERIRALATGDVALFAHGHILRVFAARWCGLDPTEGRSFSLDTATLSVLGWEHEYPTLRRWNAS